MATTLAAFLPSAARSLNEFLARQAAEIGVFGADVRRPKIFLIFTHRTRVKHDRDSSRGLRAYKRRDYRLIVDVAHDNEVEFLRDRVIDLLRLYRRVVIRREVRHLHTGLGRESGEGRGPGADIRIGVRCGEYDDSLAFGCSLRPGNTGQAQRQVAQTHPVIGA